MTQMLSLATDKAIHQSKLGYASLRHALVCVTGSDTISVVAKAVMKYASQWFELRVGARDVIHDELRHCGTIVVVARAALEGAATRTASGRAGLSSRRGSRVLYRHAVGSNFRAVLAAERRSVLRADDRPAAGLVALHRRRVPGPCGGRARRCPSADWLERANARRVLRWIRAQKKTEGSLNDDRRDALSQSLDADQTQALLDGLVKAGWLRETITPTAGRPVRRWEVNPKLFTNAESAESAETT